MNRNKETGPIGGFASSRWLAAALVLAVVVAVNLVATGIHLRKDLTAEKLYTLSDGTKRVLGDLSRTVTLKLYFSRSNPQVPISLRRFADRIQDLLNEYRLYGKGRIVVETYDPRPDTEEQEWADRYGLQARALSAGDIRPGLYLGLVAVAGKKEAALPFIAPADEPRLEYLITRLICEVIADEKPVLGVLSPLPVMPSPSPFAARPAGWIAIRELSKSYSLRSVSTNATSIDADIDLLLVIHPRRLPEKTWFAIDQYLLRGGRMILFADPLCITEESPELGGFSAGSSDPNTLIQAWGLKMSAGQVAADMSAASPVSFSSGELEELPTWLSLRGKHVNREDIATTGLELLMMPFAAVFEGEPVAGLEATPLVQTSPDAALITSFQARMPGPEKYRGARKIGTKPVALRVQGKFKTAFPDGPPKRPGETNSQETAQSCLKESVTNTAAILVGDVDMLSNQYLAREINILGFHFFEPINDNLNFVLNIVEQMAGNPALIGLRSRGRFERPFDRVLKLQQQAREKWQQEEQELVQKLRRTQHRLAELERAKSENQRYIITPEQKREIEKFRREKFETMEKLKQVRRNLRRDIERLGLELKFINLAAAPLVVTGYGLLRAWRRYRRAAGR